MVQMTTQRARTGWIQQRGRAKQRLEELDDQDNLGKTIDSLKRIRKKQGGRMSRIKECTANIMGKSKVYTVQQSTRGPENINTNEK